ncbi:hypothetical protein AGMMS49983_12280 [Clostridia bacterium]|nr:hypothetical protein AGMMS49983_12280 [Clostridia bacterium]
MANPIDGDLTGSTEEVDVNQMPEQEQEPETAEAENGIPITTFDAGDGSREINISSATAATAATAALQAALNDPSVNEIILTGGGTLQLTATLTIPHGRDITIKAASGTVILENPSPSGSSSVRHINIDARSSAEASTTLTFYGVELQGPALSSSSPVYGGGINFQADSSKTLILKGAVVRDCTNNGNGGGIFSTGNLIIDDSKITSNRGTSGGGVYLSNPAATLEIINSEISGNWATDNGTDKSYEGYYNGGGGVYSEGPLTIKGSTITDNTSGAYGGGVLAHVNATIEDSTISGNITSRQDSSRPDDYGSAIFSSSDDNLIKIDSYSVVSNRAGDNPHSGKGFSPRVLGITYSPASRTNGDVTVTLTASEPIKVPGGWKATSDKRVITKEYSANDKEEVTLESIATTNTVKRNIDITWIDKDAPRLVKLTVNGQELNLAVGANNFVNTSTGANIVAEVKDDVDSAASARIKIIADDGEHTFDGRSLALTDPGIFTPGKAYTIEVTTYDNVIAGAPKSGDLNTATYYIPFTVQGIVTVKPADRTAVYSGAPLVPNAYEIVSTNPAGPGGGLPAGIAIDDSKVLYSGSQTNVGTGPSVSAITAGSLSLVGTPADAYRIEYAPGTLTVTPRTVVITIGDRAETFSGSSFGGGLTVTGGGTVLADTGLAPGDSVSDPTIPIDPADILAGRYTYGDGESGIGATHNNYGVGFFRIVNGSRGDVTSNYSIIVTDGTFTVAEPAVVPPPAPEPPIVTPPVVTPPAVTPPEVTEPTPDPVVPEPISELREPAVFEAQTGNIFSDIARGNVPLGGFAANGAWSVLSLILSIIATLSVLILFLQKAFTRRQNGDDRQRRSIIATVFTILVGIATPIVWFILDDLSQPMVWINQWTIIVGLFFIAHIALRIVFGLKRDRSEPNVGTHI